MYEYLCPVCGPHRSNERADHVVCQSCGGHARRIWGFVYRASYNGGYSHTLGRYVRSAADLRSGLSAASDMASAPQTVYDHDGNPHVIERPPHHFVPVDPRDKAACGVTNDGLDVTYDALRRQGNHPAADALKKAMAE